MNIDWNCHLRDGKCQPGVSRGQLAEGDYANDLTALCNNLKLFSSSRLLCYLSGSSRVARSSLRKRSSDRGRGHGWII
jgi:hypothetical protein